MRTAWRISGSILLIALCAATLRAQPFIFYRGIVNAASFAPPGLPNGSIARGSIFSIFGRDLGPAGSPPLAFPLQTTLGGVAVEVCQGGNCVPAIPLFVSPGQINAVMPSNAPLGGVSIRVTYNAQAGNFSPGTVAASSLGIFTVNSAGFGPGIVQNFLAQDNQPLNSAVATVRPGQVVTLWGTGLGPGLNADSAMPQAGDLPVEVEIFVGGKRVTNKLYSGRTPCCAGVDQIVFAIPQDSPAGCYVPLTVRTAKGLVSNDVTISVSADGTSCADPHDPAAVALRQGGRLGSLSLVRGRTEDTEGGVFGIDTAAAGFGEERGGPWAFQVQYTSPPEGTCLVSAGRGAGLAPGSQVGASSPLRVLDAGPSIEIQTDHGSRFVELRPAGRPGYVDLLGAISSTPDAETSTILEPPGLVRLKSSGGSDVGPFELSLTVPPTPEWTNRDSLAVVDRSRDLSLTWLPVGGSGGAVWIIGVAQDPVNDATVHFTCPMPAGATSFAIPAVVLARMPSRAPGASPTGQLGIVAFAPQPGSESWPDGLGFLTVWAGSSAVQIVEYR